MTTTINLVGARGGVGTTTLTAALAYALRDADTTISVRGSEEDATRAVFSAPKDGPLAEGIEYNADPLDGPIDYKLVDHGTNLPVAAAADLDFRVLVVRNDYVSLRRVTNQVPTVTASGDAKELPFDIVVLVEEPGRALGRREVFEILGGDPTTFVLPVTDRIARAADAGVLNARPAELGDVAAAIATVVRQRHAITHRAVR